MFVTFHTKKKAQLVIGFVVGVAFGFLLHKGGVTRYDVIMGQLLLKDFTVVKIMLSAIVVGMVGIFFLRSKGLATLHPKTGSFGSTVIGGLIFGVGFGTLGYCPGTLAGAIGQGSLDALLGGLTGILIGAGIFAAFYPYLDRSILGKGNFGDTTFHQLLKVNPWSIVIPACCMIIMFLWLIEQSGL